jgi:hypothetical protein
MLPTLAAINHATTLKVLANKGGTVRIFRQDFALEHAIESHTCLIEANMHATNDVPLGCPLLLRIGPVNSAQILKPLHQK